MRKGTLFLAMGLFGTANAQYLGSVYNRDTHDPFRLKKVQIDQTTVGPLLRTRTVFTFDNPYKNLTEASVNFGMPQEAVLGGFGYFYGDEFVKGQLMDKAKAWFIYTAITSRDRDPGIMEQVSPTQYHCQIYPLKVGSDLRVALYSVGFIKPTENGTTLPKPVWPQSAEEKTYTLRAAGQAPQTVPAETTLPALSKPVHAVAQRFKDGRTYVAGIVRGNPSDNAKVTFARLRQPKVVYLSDDAVAFTGWVPKNRKLAVRFGGERYAFRPQRIYRGSETAKLWAQQMLAQETWTHRRDVLQFSLKYGVPSSQTALLAVPQQEMALFQKKAKEFEAEAARQRREELARQRAQRNWRGTNYRWTRGGDPEIRVTEPDAENVTALLPDGRSIKLTNLGNDTWGGNFDIPALAPEGEYRVRILATHTDGSRHEQTLSYNVDRTAPEGKARFELRAGQLHLTVTSEPDLASVQAFDAQGNVITLKPTLPGRYEIDLPAETTDLVVVLKDRAGNKRELKCSWSR